MLAVHADPGSFRDPGGQVYLLDEHVYRTVRQPAVDDFDYVESTGLIAELTAREWLVPANPVDASVLGAQAADALYVLEHPKLPFISYPYEWCFPALKAAALLHLDIHLAALERDVTLSDASAYNVQFIGAQPVFIDRLSFVRYSDGQYWTGHRQFCEQFLNPLLLHSEFGVTHNDWYRGSQEGITSESVRRLLPWHRRFLSWNLLSQVVLQASLQNKSAVDIDKADRKIRSGRLPKSGFVAMLRSMRRWIERIEPKGRRKTEWQDYAGDHSYEAPEEAAKRHFIANFARAVTPSLLIDVGCNTGDYAIEALQNGAEYAVGMDFDQGALRHGFARAARDALPLQLLYLDATNPAPDQGWAQGERKGLAQRAEADALIALALVHHLAISKNVPLPSILDWLLQFAPAGVIEFVPKNDAMVQRLLRFREDIFPHYTEDAFLAAIRERTHIVRSEKVSNAGRLLVWYDNRGISQRFS